MKMKTSITRILCLVLVLMMAVAAFTACKSDKATPTNVTGTDTSSVVSIPDPVIVEVDDDAPFAIAKDAKGKDIVILVPNKDGSVTMEVADKTTVEQFLAVVTAKEGFTIKLTDASGKEVTDAKAVIAKDMVFEVFADGESTSKVKYVINVVSQETIQKTVKQQEQIDKKKDEIQNNPSNGVGSNNTSSNKNPSSIPSGKDPVKPVDPVKPGEISIVLSSVWGNVYTASDAAGKVWQSTLANMQNKQNIKTTVNTIDANSATDTIVREVMSGKASADVYDISLVMCRNVARKKAAANIYNSKTINKNLFNTGATKSVTFGGKVYGVAFAAKSTNPMGVIYNKDLIKRYSKGTDIASLYNNKKWTFDAFQKIANDCTQDTNGDGKSDIFGFTSNTNIIGMALSANAGGTALMKNGRVEATMCNDAGIAALEWCKEMFKNDKSWKYQADINSCVNTFASGQAAMFVSYLQYYPTIASSAQFDIGFVLMPMGPEQKNYINGVYDASLYVVPKTKESRLDDIGKWLNGLAASSGHFVNIKVQDLARNGFDTTSQNIYKWVVNNMTAEFSSGPFSSEISSQVDSSVTSASKSPSKVMAAIKSQAQKECDDYYAPLY